MSAVSTGESGSPALLVGFESATKSKSMYESFLNALPGAGYAIANKVFIDGGDEGGAIAIEARARPARSSSPAEAGPGTPTPTR